MNTIYLDNAATTSIAPEVIEAMTDSLKNNYGNPSSSHSIGRSSKTVIETCRKKIALLLNADPSEIVFVSCGTEGDNYVLQSAVKSLGVKHIITSKIEHHAVLHTAQALESLDVKLSYVNLNEKGNIDFSHLEQLITESNQKTLVSLMHVNNEVGNILDMQKVGHLCKQFNVLFHSDTVQSVGKIPIDLKKIPVDFIVASAHKFHGPKGIGFVFIRKNTGLSPILYGGEQERGLRPGTEAVHNIVGLTKALELAINNLEKDREHITFLKSTFISKLKKALPHVKFNGNSDNKNQLSAYTIVNFRLPITNLQSNMFLFQLDLKGIASSQGSACQSGSSKGSHVLNELLDDKEQKKPSLRFSFSKYNTHKEIDYAVSILKELVEKN
jgi:cysteine desulfurase